jgi:DNA-binding CsgD family transcriptional regulator
MIPPPKLFRASSDSFGFESDGNQIRNSSKPCVGDAQNVNKDGTRLTRDMLSTEEIILKNSLSLLDPIEITGILCLGVYFKDELSQKLDKCAVFPNTKSIGLKSVFRTALSSQAFDVLSEKTSTPFLSTLWAPKNELPENKTGGSYILTKAFGPRGLMGLFMLEMKKVEASTNSSVLEHVQQVTQTAFSKIVLLGNSFSQPSRLTPREKEIAKWIAYGKSNNEIAEKMDISIHTVNGYLRAIYLKTQTSDRVSVGFYALHNGLLD